MKREKNPNQRAFKIVTKKQIVITKPTDEPIPEIDTAKAVAFAMSIAQEMKQRQREADEAKLAGYQFLDSDLVIMQRDGRLLREIIEQDGIEGFLSIENRVNASISTHNTIIATGGSVIFGDGAMYHLASIGTIVYLRASYETVASRVTDLKGRGVAMKPAQTLREIYEERKDLYEKFAEYIIDVDKQSIEATAKELAKIARNG